MQNNLDLPSSYKTCENQNMSDALELDRYGFIRFKASLNDTPSTEVYLKEIQESFHRLPVDPYDPSANRHRRYSSAVLLPWSRTLQWMPPLYNDVGDEISVYRQGNFNPEYSGQSRYFSPIDGTIRKSELLIDLIWGDYDRTMWESAEQGIPKYVGVHFVSLRVAISANEAISSPNHLHQDGETYTFAHLIQRQNAHGATNYIAGPQCAHLLPEDIAPHKIMASFDLHQPFESYGVLDRKVSHYVSALQKADNSKEAVRSIILIDFTPYVPRI